VKKPVGIAPFTYFGSKARLQSQIAELLDYSCHTYVEPFGGSGRVLLNKYPHEHEIYSDANVGLASFFYFLSKPQLAEQLIGELYTLENTPEEFSKAKIYLTAALSEGNIQFQSDLKLAKATFVVCSQSRDGLGMAATWSNPKQLTQDQYLAKVERLWDVAERLNDVEVRHSLTLPLIEPYLIDPDVMIYLDPPYLDKRGQNFGGYAMQMLEADHCDLLNAIKNCKAKIIISNYGNMLYNEYLHGWQRIEIETFASIARPGTIARTEVLWLNY
jgi:DNA adenine methylase